MNILVLCHYFAPEPGAPSARLLELGQSWTRAGDVVKVVTCFPNHPTGVIPPQYRGRFRSTENLRGIQVFRNWVYATPNEGVLKKTLGHISFMVSSVLLSLPRVGPVDVVVSSSPTFFSLFSGYVFAKLTRSPFVAEIRDLWPAAIIELGVLRNRLVIRLLELLELWIYRVASHVVVVTESFRANLIARGIPASKITVITNGVDLERFSPGPKDPNVEAELGCAGRQLVLYAGAVGLSHGLEAVVHAANLLRDHEGIVFGIVGDGAAKPKLQQLVSNLGLGNVRFMAAQSKDRMASIYRTADICVVPLRDVPLFSGFIPSKMFEIMACGRPIVAALKGESAEIAKLSGGALVVPPEDSQAIAEAVLSLSLDVEMRLAMGRSAITFVKEHYSRAALAGQYGQLLVRVSEEAKVRVTSYGRHGFSG